MTELEKSTADSGLASRRMLSLDELAEISCVSLAHLRRLIDRGDGPKVTKLGARAVRVRTADAIDWLDRLGLKMPRSKAGDTKPSQSAD